MGKKRRQKWHSGYPSKREAERALAGLLAARYDGSYVEPSRLTLGAFLLDRWLSAAATTVRPTTLIGYRRHEESTALGYLEELARKYAPGTPISRTPSNPPGVAGRQLRGSMVLEVPPQAAPIPQAVLDRARQLRIVIREVTTP